jgi:hypothetical protein
LNLRCRLTGEGIKPPNGAAIKSCGTERFGKGNLRDYQVWIKELNESEPLMRSREVVPPVKSDGVCDGVISLAATCLLAKRQASYKRQDLYVGLITELGNLQRNGRQ